MISKEKELLHMQIRLFRMACRKWNLSNHECAAIFDMYSLDEYIEDCYGFFHIQGDDVNLFELSEYAKSKGAEI